MYIQLNFEFENCKVGLLFNVLARLHHGTYHTLSHRPLNFLNYLLWNVDQFNLEKQNGRLFHFPCNFFSLYISKYSFRILPYRHEIFVIKKTFFFENGQISFFSVISSFVRFYPQNNCGKTCKVTLWWHSFFCLIFWIKKRYMNWIHGSRILKVHCVSQTNKKGNWLISSVSICKDNIEKKMKRSHVVQIDSWLSLKEYIKHIIYEQNTKLRLSDNNPDHTFLLPSFFFFLWIK